MEIISKSYLSLFMVIGGKGIMPTDSGEKPVRFSAVIRRVLLCRSDKPIRRNYFAFWKTDNSGYYIEEFADILRLQFSRR